MASFRVEWKPSTKKNLRRISPDQVARIVDAAGGLAIEPRPDGSKKLQGTEHTREKVGDPEVEYIRIRAEQTVQATPVDGLSRGLVPWVRRA